MSKKILMAAALGLVLGSTASAGVLSNDLGIDTEISANYGTNNSFGGSILIGKNLNDEAAVFGQARGTKLNKDIEFKYIQAAYAFDSEYAIVYAGFGVLDNTIDVLPIVTAGLVVPVGGIPVNVDVYLADAHRMGAKMTLPVYSHRFEGQNLTFGAYVEMNKVEYSGVRTVIKPAPHPNENTTLQTQEKEIKNTTFGNAGVQVSLSF